jgi:hypothetical protein
MKFKSSFIATFYWGLLDDRWYVDSQYENMLTQYETPLRYRRITYFLKIYCRISKFHVFGVRYRCLWGCILRVPKFYFWSQKGTTVAEKNPFHTTPYPSEVERRSRDTLGLPLER